MNLVPLWDSCGRCPAQGVGIKYPKSQGVESDSKGQIEKWQYVYCNKMGPWIEIRSLEFLLVLQGTCCVCLWASVFSIIK